MFWRYRVEILLFVSVCAWGMTSPAPPVRACVCAWGMTSPGISSKCVQIDFTISIQPASTMAMFRGERKIKEY